MYIHKIGRDNIPRMQQKKHVSKNNRKHGGQLKDKSKTKKTKQQPTEQLYKTTKD